MIDEKSLEEALKNVPDYKDIKPEPEPEQTNEKVISLDEAIDIVLKKTGVSRETWDSLTADERADLIYYSNVRFKTRVKRVNQ
jgi:uncharacterized membrane protein YkoI